jgi:hypothetical protein
MAAAGYCLFLLANIEKSFHRNLESPGHILFCLKKKVPVIFSPPKK